MEFKIESHTVDDHTVVLKLSGEMDIYTAPQLKEKAFGLIKDGHSRIVLELSELKYKDSTGLGAMIASLTRAHENGGALGLVAPQRPVKRLLEMVGIDENVLRVYPDVDAAIAGVKETAA